MRKVQVSENGKFLDAETGEVIGDKDLEGMNRASIPEKAAAAPPPAVPLFASERKQDMPPVREEAVSYTRYEVRPDSEFEVHFCLGFKDGRVLFHPADAYLRDSGLEQHWVKFRMWNYSEELAWKKQGMEYNAALKSFFLNQAILDELKIRNLIKSWSFTEIDDKFRLLHVNRILSDESYDVFKGIFPVIINNIIHLMNQVLEHNG